MPAIAFLEELKAPRKDLYAVRYALCSMQYIGFGLSKGIQK